jgi:hypothetical protein
LKFADAALVIPAEMHFHAVIALKPAKQSEGDPVAILRKAHLGDETPCRLTMGCPIITSAAMRSYNESLEDGYRCTFLATISLAVNHLRSAVLQQPFRKCLPVNRAEAMIISSKFMAQKDDFNQPVLPNGGQKRGVLEILED